MSNADIKCRSLMLSNEVNISRETRKKRREDRHIHVPHADKNNNRK